MNDKDVDARDGERKRGNGMKGKRHTLLPSHMEDVSVRVDACQPAHTHTLFGRKVCCVNDDKLQNLHLFLF